MNDLVARLRSRLGGVSQATMDEAADEIERLQEDLFAANTRLKGLAQTLRTMSDAIRSCNGEVGCTAYRLVDSAGTDNE